MKFGMDAHLLAVANAALYVSFYRPADKSWTDGTPAASEDPAALLKEALPDGATGFQFFTKPVCLVRAPDERFIQMRTDERIEEGPVHLVGDLADRAHLETIRSGMDSARRAVLDRILNVLDATPGAVAYRSFVKEVPFYGIKLPSDDTVVVDARGRRIA